ncbi:MAG: right-handed parallel beta-helix repeat-containing protein [Acidobacteriota bacterium]|nr:MAG: right-handed parallel beta-helix repeat-containing protein [Acidobacteriota bacterium]
MIPGGEVAGRWDASRSPYRVQGDITVPAGQTLTIEPGVEIFFESWYSLSVSGTLDAVGTAADPILFTTVDPDTHWLGVRFIGAPDGSRLTHCIIERGQATGAAPLDGGGGLYIEGSDPVIRHCTLRNNFAKRSGGAIHLEDSSATLSNNLIVNNSVGAGAGSAFGGAIYMRNSSPTLTGNTIRENSVSVSGSYSTPSGLGGAIYARSSDPKLKYNVITDNVASGHLNSNVRGGAIYFYYGSPELIGNTISDNRADNGPGVYQIAEGGALYGYYANPVIVNTIVWNNLPEEIWIKSGGPPNLTEISY